MRFFGLLLRLFSYLFHLSLGAFLAGIALIAASSHQTLNMGMLPFSDEHVISGTVLLGVAGIICTLLAFTRVFRFVFTLWAALILYLTIKGFFFSSYTFNGTNGLKTALWLSLAALGAFLGAVWALRPRRGRAYL